MQRTTSNYFEVSKKEVYPVTVNRNGFEFIVPIDMLNASGRIPQAVMSRIDRCVSFDDMDDLIDDGIEVAY